MAHDNLAGALGGLIESSGESFGMLVLHVRAPDVAPLAKRLHGEFGFDLLLDATAIDYPQRVPRFDVVYHFYSSTQKQRVRVKASVVEQDPTVPTLTELYGSARFLEREVHEMYGIVFEGNADLRPILLYEGFIGNPLRKDYPMDREQPIVPYRE